MDSLSMALQLRREKSLESCMLHGSYSCMEKVLR